MKLIKTIIPATVAIMGLAFTSCNETADVPEYTLASNVDGVYFPTDDATAVTVDPEDTDFTVVVARTEGLKAGAATYKLTADGDLAKFDVPATVTFAEGATTANVVIGNKVVPTDLNKTFNLTIGFEEGTQLYPWGLAEYSVAVTIDAKDPNKYWAKVGTCWVIDGWCCSAYKFTMGDGTVATPEDLAWPVDLYESLAQSGNYRLESPWTNEDCVLVYLDINENTTPTNIFLDCINPECVKLLPQYSGCTMDGDDYWIFNMAGYRVLQGLTDAQIIARGENSVLEEDGYIDIYPAVFGIGANDLGYTWNSDPSSGFMLEFDDAAAAPRKQLGSNLARAIKYNKVDVKRYLLANALGK